MMSFLKFVTLVATLTVGVLSNGATEKPQQYRCYLDWCKPPWQYCDSDEERCAPCSFDICRRSQGIPKNCTQACQELLPPKTTSQVPVPGSLAESKGSDDRLEALSQQIQTLQNLVIIVIVVVVAIAVAIGAALYKRRKTCRRNVDTEQPEEKKPLQATESDQSSDSRDSPPFLPAVEQYPGETPLDKGAPPIFRPIAVGPNQPPMVSRPSEQAQAYPASSSLFSRPPQSPGWGAGAMSMPGGPAGQGMSGSAFPVSMPLTQQDANRIQDHKGFNADFDVSGNMGPGSRNGRDVRYDTDSTAPKSNDFGTRPMDL